MADAAQEVVENTEELEATTEENEVEASGDLENHGFPVGDDDEIETVEEEDEVVNRRQTFADRIEDMGLTEMGDGCYHYADEHCEVAYRSLYTGGGAEIMDNVAVPHLSLFTKGLEEDDDWKRAGLVSDAYRFTGNGALIEAIKASIVDAGSPIFREASYLTANKTQIRHEIIVQNETNIPSVGDVYPLIVIKNSYDGTMAANISFGLFFNDSDDLDVMFGSKQNWGNIRQVHLEGAQADLSGPLGGYVTAFSENIADLVQTNLDNELTEQEMLATLDVIERSAGKKRREALSAILEEMHDGEEGDTPMTSWKMFHAITRFSTMEKNLNAKLLLENMAERVLVVPPQMLEVLSELQG